MVSTYRELEKVCQALGLTRNPKKNGVIWEGLINGEYVQIVIHIHRAGKDVGTGLMRKYIKELGFKSEQEYFDYLRNI